MKISLGYNSLPPRDVAAARSCVAINLLCLPGLGSWIAGRKSGVLQMAMALIGLGLTTFWFVTFLGDWVRTQQYPWEGGAHLGLGLMGLDLFILAWLWSLGTGLSILRQARSESTPPRL